jgi:hypothetical protein
VTGQEFHDVAFLDRSSEDPFLAGQGDPRAGRVLFLGTRDRLDRIQESELGQRRLGDVLALQDPGETDLLQGPVDRRRHELADQRVVEVMLHPQMRLRGDQRNNGLGHLN